MHPGRPHILMAIDTLEVGGAQYHLLALARGLSDRGYRITLVTSSGALCPDFEAVGIHVLQTETGSIGRRVSERMTSALANLLCLESVDLLHAHLHGASVAAAIASGYHAAPLIVTQHSRGTWQSSRDRALARWARSTASAVIAVSRDIHRESARDGIAAHLITNGIDMSAPQCSSALERAVRARFGIPADAYVVGCACRLVEDKDPLLFVESAAGVARSCPHAHFVLAGDGPLYHAVVERARELGLTGRVTFPGFMPRAAATSLFDALVLTSRSEGSPLVVLEAMAAGKPVVAVPVGDVPYQVRHGSTGFLARSRTPDEIASLILKLADAGLRDRFGSIGRAHVASHFALERMVAQTTQVYWSVLARGHQMRSRTRLAGAS